MDKVRIGSVLVICCTMGLWLCGCAPVRPQAGSDAAVPTEEPVTVEPTDAPEGKPQTMCPVMDQPIERLFYKDYQGKRVYFSCSVCTRRFMQDPEKYMAILKEQGVVLEDAPEE